MLTVKIDGETIQVLSPEERQEIDKELAHSPTAQAASIEAMKVIQKHRGWVSDESLVELAEYIKMSPAALDNVATFYNLIFRRKVGKHIVMICDSVSCWLTGYEKVRQKIIARLGITMGQTTDDGNFTLLPIVCLGVCEHAPAMMVDDETYWDLTDEKIDEIFDGIK